MADPQMMVTEPGVGTVPERARVPLYVVSRDDSPERLVSLWAEAERMGVPLVRVGASEGAPGEDDVLLRASDHRRAWERIVESGVSAAIVLDDDVSLDDRLAPFLDAATLIEALPERGLINLDGGHGGEGETRIEHTLGMPARCGAYALGGDTARALLDAPRHLEPLERGLLRHREHGVELRVALPAPVVSPDRADGPEHRAGFAGFVARLSHALTERSAKATPKRRSPAAAVPPLAPAVVTSAK